MNDAGHKGRGTRLVDAGHKGRGCKHTRKPLTGGTPNAKHQAWRSYQVLRGIRACHPVSFLVR
jgi:hypothetical protein